MDKIAAKQGQNVEGMIRMLEKMLERPSLTPEAHTQIRKLLDEVKNLPPDQINSQLLDAMVSSRSAGDEAARQQSREIKNEAHAQRDLIIVTYIREEVAEGTKLDLLFKTAAKKFKVSRSTVRRAWYRRNGTPAR